MQDFEFISPTKIFFGQYEDFAVGDIVKNYRYKNILIVYGQSTIKKNGLYDRIVSSLDREKIKHCEISGVRPNPSSSLVRAGVYLAKEKKIDFILAIGGGSVIDTAKSIAVGYYYDGDPFDFNLYIEKPKKALPIGVVLTISAAGSELSSSCVIMNDATGIKQGFNSDIVKPVFAIMNPKLTFSVSPYQTACGIVDIISHSLERYFSKSEKYEFSDSLALAIIKDVIRNGRIAMKEPDNYDVRACLMLESSYSHNGLTGLGKKVAFPIHAMEHALSAYDVRIAHGAGLAVLIPSWMEAAYTFDLDKFDRFGREVFDVRFASKEESARIAIQSLRDYFHEIGMPITLKELNLSEHDIPALADKMTESGTRVVGQFSVRPLNREDIVKLLTKSF